MYSQIAGAGAAAGLPAVLAVTGVTGPSITLVLGAGLGAIGAGVAILRVAHRNR
jgi:hypothetical protein